jgi:hypothetical protein
MSKTFFPQGFKSDDDKTRKEVVSDKFAEIEQYMLREFPSCRERSVALTHLETAAMWATKALTHGIRSQDPTPQSSEPKIVNFSTK